MFAECGVGLRDFPMLTSQQLDDAVRHFDDRIAEAERLRREAAK